MPVNNWFSINLGDGMMAHERIDHIETRFADLYASADRAEDLAAFIRHESEGRLHCEVMVYFSPASVVVARAVGAEPCPKPSPIGLGLLAGSETSWMQLFPERGG